MTEPVFTPVRSARAAPGRTRSSRAPDRRSGGWAACTSALTPVALSFAGQTSTHRSQPVQSSGATWIEYFMPSNSCPAIVDRLERRRRVEQQGRVDRLDPQRRVRADERALVALDAQARVPDRDFVGDVALLEFRRADRKRAVGRHRRHRQRVAVARAIIGIVTLRTKSGNADRRGRPACQVHRAAGSTSRPIAISRTASIPASIARSLAATTASPLAPYDFFAARLIAAIAGVARQDAREREEARLQHGVDALAGPAASATAPASIANTRRRLSRICCCAASRAARPRPPRARTGC